MKARADAVLLGYHRINDSFSGDRDTAEKTCRQKPADGLVVLWYIGGFFGLVAVLPQLRKRRYGTFHF
jgi:hypothetical protein